jgi:hypothetical protein
MVDTLNIPNVPCEFSCSDFLKAYGVSFEVVDDGNFSVRECHVRESYRDWRKSKSVPVKYFLELMGYNDIKYRNDTHTYLVRGELSRRACDKDSSFKLPYR